MRAAIRTKLVHLGKWIKLVQIAIWYSVNGFVRINFIHIRYEVDFNLKRGFFNKGQESGAKSHLPSLGKTLLLLTSLCGKMYELRKKITSTLIILLSGLAAAANFNAILAILLTYSHRRQQKLLAAQINNSSVKIARINRAIKLSKRKNVTRSFWERPGRTGVWWCNFTRNIVVPEEWRENFRMSRDSFYVLCNELRPFIERQTTHLRKPISVEKQVAVTLCYLSDEGRYRKVAKHLESQGLQFRK